MFSLFRFWKNNMLSRRELLGLCTTLPLLKYFDLPVKPNLPVKPQIRAGWTQMSYWIRDKNCMYFSPGYPIKNGTIIASSLRAIPQLVFNQSDYVGTINYSAASCFIEC